MWNFIKSKKWYLLHGAAVVAAFLTPSVQAFASGHGVLAGGIVLGWGWLLHFLDGQQTAASQK